MNKRLIIAGAGGFGRGIFGWVTSSPKFLQKCGISDIAFINDSQPSVRIDAPLHDSITAYVPGPRDLVICAIGNPTVRQNIVRMLSGRGAIFQTFVDDRAIIGPKVTIDEGAVICPGTVISAGARIQQQVHVNFNCSIGHDTEIGRFSTLSPSVNLMGELRIGNSVFFGGSSTVLPRLQVGARSQIGAGAVVTKNVPKEVVVKGIPGRWDE